MSSSPKTVVRNIKTLTADGGAVRVEREERFLIGGQPIDHQVVGVFGVDANNRISRWRDYYDPTSAVDRVGAATTPSTQTT